MHSVVTGGLVGVWGVRERTQTMGVTRKPRERERERETLSVRLESIARRQPIIRTVAIIRERPFDRGIKSAFPSRCVSNELFSQTRSEVFWDVTRRGVIIVYRRFGTTYRSQPHTLSRNVGKQISHDDA
jgi:hypothetical protein